MNKVELLNDLKQVRKKHQYFPLDPLIHHIANELIQDKCPHIETGIEKGSCYYGEYETQYCKTCGKVLNTVKGW